jgi:acetyl esterase/lipase
MTKTLAALLLTVPLIAQQPKKTPNQNPPFVEPPDVDIQRNLVYATVGSRELHLDLYLPKKSPAIPMPAVVYIHGGGWVNGSKVAFQRHAAYMATKGYAGACIEYRLSGEAKYPAAIDDSKAAVRWVRANAKKYNIDPNRIGAAGGSAGGHLVALLGTATDDPASRVAAVAAFNPAVDLVDFGTRMTENSDNSVVKFLNATYQDKPELYKSASPTYQVTAKSAPTLFLHGDADPTVPYKQSMEMMQKLKAAGVRTEIFTAPGAKHGFFNAPPWYDPALKKMEEFFDAVLRPRT